MRAQLDHVKPLLAFCVTPMMVCALAGAGCGGSKTNPSPVTTSTSTSTTVASTTTTTVPATTTTTTTPASTTTTTTSIAALTASFSVQNTPCTAPQSGNVSCSFVGSASGGQGGYAFSWQFTNPASGQVVSASGQTVSPALGCGFSAGVSTFNVAFVLTVTSGGASATASGTQQMARPSGNCV